MEKLEKDLGGIIEDGFRETQGSTGYSNDRQRPYDGQPWTDSGVRGMTEVKGLTMRDVRDCLTKAFLVSAAGEDYFKNFGKCWDYNTVPASPTAFLLQNIDHPHYVHCKVQLGTWHQEDLYKIDLRNIDPVAVGQNLTVEIEKMMGIYPNIPQKPDSFIQSEIK